MTSVMRYPVRGALYTFQEIISELKLRDWPFFMFYHPDNGDECVLQDSHCTYDELLQVEGLGASEWRYVRETDEWIPLFHYSGDSEALKRFFDIVPYTDHRERTEFWVTPKGFPRAVGL